MRQRRQQFLKCSLAILCVKEGIGAGVSLSLFMGCLRRETESRRRSVCLLLHCYCVIFETFSERGDRGGTKKFERPRQIKESLPPPPTALPPLPFHLKNCHLALAAFLAIGNPDSSAQKRL